MEEPRPGWLRWVLLQSALLVAAASGALAFGILPGLAQRAAWLALLAAVAAGAAVLLWPMAPPDRRQAMGPKALMALGGALAVGIALRGWAAWSSDVPLGYDYGFYKAAFDAYSAGDLPLRSQPHWMALQFEPGLPALHAVLHGVSGLSSHDHLRYLFPVLATATALPVFMAARAYGGTLAGLLAAGLIAVSSLQLEAHAYLYEKNLVALAFTAAALFAMRRDAPLVAGLLLGAVGAWHRPTLLLCALGFALGILVQPTLLRSWRSWTGTAAVAVAVFIPVWLAMPETFFTIGRIVAEQSSQAIAAGSSTAGPGTFAPTAEAMRQMTPYLPLAGAAAVVGWRHPGLRLPVALAVVAFGYVALELPLHRRFLLMADLAAILVAGLALAPLAGRRAAALAVACIVLAAGLGVAATVGPRVPHRFLEERQWHELDRLDMLPENAALVADNLRAPYVMAERGSQVYGPGLFDDPHNRSDWQRFWAGLRGPPLAEFMSGYSSPVFFVQVDEPGPDWSSASLRDPEFVLVHDEAGVRVWRYAGGEA